MKDSTDTCRVAQQRQQHVYQLDEGSGIGRRRRDYQRVLSDINNDRAVDLVVTGANGAPTVYLNQREGPFKAMPLYDAAGLAPATGVYVFDFNKDGWMDVALTHAGAPGVSLWRNVDGNEVRARAAARYRRDERLGRHRHRLRQRRLDRPRCRGRDREGHRSSRLPQQGRAGL